ncbi:MAG: DNA (cytosine-5-)-methyltransferase [Candidatus Thorarchaeota archaeon]|jgi:DNA (cytosine-5)-methyltransferase 1
MGRQPGVKAVTIASSEQGVLPHDGDVLYNHVCAKLSEFDMEMIRAVPPGGNWQDIPVEIASRSSRLTQIRRSGGRTTYYGRLHRDLPSYTINTYFNRPGNGCFIHPTQDRLISQREAARLQSFPDSFRFLGSTTSIYKQIGNAVPPLLAKAIGSCIPKGDVVDLFAGAGGLSAGLMQAGHRPIIASDIDRHMCATYKQNHHDAVVMRLDITDSAAFEHLVTEIENRLAGRTLRLIAGGPPCQGFSTAGNWDTSDSRNSLFTPFLQVVERMVPDYVLVENVQGIQWINDGKTLRAILSSLENMDYSTTCMTLKAEQYGVPQRRRRVFILGSRREAVSVGPTPLFTPTPRGSRRRRQEPPDSALPCAITVEEAISDLPVLGSGEGDHVSPYDSSSCAHSYQLFIRGAISWEEFMKMRA